MVSTLLAKLSPFFLAAANNGNNGGTGVTVPPVVGTIISYAGGIGGGIVALFLIVSIVKDAISYANGNGNGSVLKIIGKVIFLILMIGLVFLALNWQNLGATASNIGGGALDQVTSAANGIVGGGGGVGGNNP